MSKPIRNERFRKHPSRPDSTAREPKFLTCASNFQARPNRGKILPRVLNRTHVAISIGDGALAVGDTVVLPLTTAQTALPDIQLVPFLQADKQDLEKSNGLLEAEITNGSKSLYLERQPHASDNNANKAALTAKDGELAILLVFLELGCLFQV
jgi:hypothetical protein